MKKRLIAILLVVCSLALTACDGEDDGKAGESSGASNMSNASNVVSEEASEDEPTVKEFLNFINDGKYIDAIECYNKNIYGNYEYEEKVEETISGMLTDLNNDILAGSKSEQDGKKVLNVLDNVMAETSLAIENYSSVKEEIGVSILSKTSFMAGQELEQLKNYVDAVSEYAKVVAKDSNYTEAQNAMDRCTAEAKKIVLDKAASLVSKGEFVEAIDALEEFDDKIPNDNEILAKMTVYQKTYVSNVLEQAEKLFVNPESDWAASLGVVNAALQHLPFDESLISERDYYFSFSPASVYDMNKLKGSAHDEDTMTDIYGNTYEKCFVAYGTSTDVSYYLNGNYNKFEATLFCYSDSNSYINAKLIIYGDEKILYQKLSIKDNATKPTNIEIDVTGVSELRIEFRKQDNGNAITGSPKAGLSNMYLQKTVK